MLIRKVSKNPRSFPSDCIARGRQRRGTGPRGGV